ncbi:His-Xaa-Ser system protein HxsD [Patescibacteria group bacterium]|nr:His-Xaa-Ser system protein HxsD [Patescibacteria group bacterium]
MVDLRNNTIRFVFDLQNYPKEALYGAAYVFLDKAYLFLDNKSSRKIEVSLKGKNKLNEKQLKNLKGEFLNELLNYTVRINLSKNNRKIREYIISQALFSAFGDDQVNKEDEVKYEDDPLGIAIPWEDKYGEKTEKTIKKQNRKTA